ncbi:Os07g0145166 [Oryza sativa Japonica Group]|uniref:Os07g0145166 protein n=1 Tax=Oryza sativa subsp. japonica TaxID=39947 RepID=A0A0P0X2S0_ORYSJ|nr:Os07g0145166 [Oryza sativa Japonica Group]
MLWHCAVCLVRPCSCAARQRRGTAAVVVRWMRQMQRRYRVAREEARSEPAREQEVVATAARVGGVACSTCTITGRLRCIAAAHRRCHARLVAITGTWRSTSIIFEGRTAPAQGQGA